MNSDNKMHPLVFHGAGLFISCLFIFPLGPIAYIVCVGVYHLGKWLPRSLRSRRQRRLDAADASRRLTEEKMQFAKAERKKAVAEQRYQADQKRHRAEQSRRVESRAQCEFLYNLHVPEISDRFGRSMFDAFIKTYMGDQHPPEDVERRGVELRRIIEQHLEKVAPETKPRTIQELSEWYLAEKERIDSLGIDPRMKKEQLFALNNRYSELTQDLLEKMEP